MRELTGYPVEQTSKDKLYEISKLLYKYEPSKNGIIDFLYFSSGRLQNGLKPFASLKKIMYLCITFHNRRGARVVEEARLESTIL